MGRVEADTWFFSDKRYRGLIAEERLVLLLVALHKKSSIGVLSSKSGLVQEVVRVIIDRLIDNKLIEQRDEFFYLADKSGNERTDIAVIARDNPEYLEILERLYEAINTALPETAKKLKPKQSDYDSIRLMVENDRVPVRSILGIISIYPTIPFWGEKSIIQSAKGLRKHWSRLYKAAEKHYNSNRVEKI